MTKAKRYDGAFDYYYIVARARARKKGVPRQAKKWQKCRGCIRYYYYITRGRPAQVH